MVDSSYKSQAQPQKQVVGKNTARVLHVLVALCDNEHQGIVPVPAKIGNGDDPQTICSGSRALINHFFAKRFSGFSGTAIKGRLRYNSPTSRP